MDAGWESGMMDVAVGAIEESTGSVPVRDVSPEEEPMRV